MKYSLDFTNPGHLKLALLSQGIKFDDKALSDIGKMSKEKVRSYNNSDFTETPIVPQELSLGDGVIVGVHWRDDSPWSVNGKEDRLDLTYKGRAVKEVHVFDRPKYYDTEVVEGISAKRIGVTLGKGAVSFFLREYCNYWDIGKPCKFCSLKPTQKKFKETEFRKDADLIARVIQLIKETGDELHHIQFSGGSDADHDKEFKEYINSIKAVSKVLGRRIDGNLITMPPKELILIDEAYKAGMNQISFNLEVWDEDAFSHVCPGKDLSYGRSDMIEALEYAAGVFKKGTYTTFVGGLEPLETMFKGWEYLASKGVAPAFNIFHPNPDSPFKRKKAPSTDYLMEAARFLHDIYQAYDFIPLLCKSCNRNALDNEAKEGYFQ